VRDACYFICLLCLLVAVSFTSSLNLELFSRQRNIAKASYQTEYKMSLCTLATHFPLARFAGEAYGQLIPDIHKGKLPIFPRQRISRSLVWEEFRGSQKIGKSLKSAKLRQ